VGSNGEPPATGGTEGMGGAPPAVPPADEVSRFRRLTHREWEQTTRDLLHLGDSPGLSDAFRLDPKQRGYLFEGNGDALEVDQNLWNSYQVAAAQLAADVTADEELLLAILPPADDMGEDERAELFIEEFGTRAHRHPLTDSQADAYWALYEQGKTAYTDVSGFVAGVRLLLEGFLQSPYFLYRVEESSKVQGEGIPLDGYERASRLSYFLWGTMPDDEMLSAAADGDLDDAVGLRAQAERLIEDERAGDMLTHFFERVLEVERYQAIAPSSSKFPDTTATLSESAASETSGFLLSEMYEKAGNLRDLLTSTTTLVDAELARIYGLDGDFDVAFQSAALDAEQRRGVLTQVGFLASHATSVEPDPIHRGVFVARRVACMEISAPPDGVPPLPPSTADKTNRQLVAEHTEAEGTACRNCHAEFINPFGFAFENYDAVGAYRDMDGDFPVDSSAVVWLDQEQVGVGSAVDLAEVLAESRQVHDCFSGHLVAYALGRPRSGTDDELVQALGELSLEKAVPFRELMVEVAVAIVELGRAEPEVEEP
jgi:hypothetical protein